MKYTILFFTCVIFASCSNMALSPNNSDRTPAGLPASCADAIKDFFSNKKVATDLNSALEEKQLISFKDKLMIVESPKLDWYNKVKKSFYQSLRNWNNNRYPAFYTFSEEEVVPTAKRYAENLDKILANQIAAEDAETTKAAQAVSDWMKLYSNYKTDMDQLIEERVSLQYNINLLKKINLPDSGSQDVQIAIKRAGVLQTETVTLRKEDKNVVLVIKKLQKQIADLDGTLKQNGKIKDRIIRQAMLQDMLNIVQREVEYVSKNSEAANEEIAKELATLNSLLANNDFSPSSYGVYKISNKVFITELKSVFKLNIPYKKVSESAVKASDPAATVADPAAKAADAATTGGPIAKVKTIVSNFFANTNNDAGTEEEKIGILKRTYAKITSISAKSVAVAGGTTVLAGIGIERYFWFKEKNVTEVSGGTKSQPVESGKNQDTENAKTQGVESAKGQSVENPNDTSLDKPASGSTTTEDQAHQQQLENTKKVENDKNAGHSSVVEIQIDDATK